MGDFKGYCIVLYCIVLYCIVLYCIVLYCIVLYCIVLYCISSCLVQVLDLSKQCVWANKISTYSDHLFTGLHPTLDRTDHWSGELSEVMDMSALVTLMTNESLIRLDTVNESLMCVCSRVHSHSGVITISLILM